MGIRNPENSYLGTLYEEINKIFRELLRHDPAAERSLETMAIPSVDIYETAGHIIIEAEMPGINPGSIQLDYSGGRIIIEGVKDEALEPGRLNYICMERSFGRFHRVIPLIKAVNASQIEAVYRQGILTVKMPKIEEKRGERISVKIQRIPDSEENLG